MLYFTIRNKKDTLPITSSLTQPATKLTHDHPWRQLLKPFSLLPPTSLDLGLQISGSAFLQSASPSLNPDSLSPQASKITFSFGFLQKNSSVLHLTNFPLPLFRSVSLLAGKLRARMRIKPGFFYLLFDLVMGKETEEHRHFCFFFPLVTEKICVIHSTLSLKTEEEIMK